MPPTELLLRALRTAQPKLDTRLELHHRIMQSVYAHHDLTRVKRQIQSVERPIATRAAKVGRNDPCPCGSGKKYKKCCGSGIKT